MAFTVESLESPHIQSRINELNQFDLPERSIDPRDPKTLVPKEPPAAAADTTQTQAPITEGLAPEEATTGESVTLSPKISALARKEQAQRQREFALKQREKSLEAKLAKADQLEKLEAKLKAKDFSGAEELGLTYEEYTQYLLGKEAQKNPTEQRLTEIQKAQGELDKKLEELTNREYQANQGLWRAEISRVITENPDFSTIKELGAEGIVLQHINDSFDEDGTELSAEDACKDIEAALFERAQKFAGVSKIKSKQPVETKPTLGPPKSSPTTITQTMTTSSQKPSTKPFHLMSESEQLAEAIRRVQAAKNQR